MVTEPKRGSARVNRANQAPGWATLRRNPTCVHMGEIAVRYHDRSEFPLGGPCGNALVFKAFADPTQLFAK